MVARSKSARSGPWRSSDFPLGFARQAEDPLADDVLLDLIGSAVDGLGPAEQKRALKCIELIGRALEDRPGHALDVHGELPQLTMPCRPVQLDDRGFGWCHGPVEARQAAQGVEPQDLEF